MGLVGVKDGFAAIIFVHYFAHFSLLLLLVEWDKWCPKLHMPILMHLKSVRPQVLLLLLLMITHRIRIKLYIFLRAFLLYDLESVYLSFCTCLQINIDFVFSCVYLNPFCLLIEFK